MSNDKNENGSDKSENPFNAATGGIFDGVANLIGKLGELAEKGEELRRNGDFQTSEGKEVKGSYGFSVKFGPGGERNDQFKVQPTASKSNSTAGSRPTTPAKPEDREPQVDVFSEEDHVLVVAEMPGVSVENISVDFDDKSMLLKGESPRVKFSKQVELPQVFSPENVDISVNNGVVEIRLNLPE